MSYSNLEFVTRGDSSPSGKPRIFYCCHPDDYERYFHTVTDDIFSCQSKVTVWHLPSSASQKWTEEDLAAFENDLSQMQLLVIPVTSRFLFDENRALMHDIPFAVAHSIPLLPILMEPGLEFDFNAKCGNLQCLSRLQRDATELPYQQKLNAFLEKVIVSSDFINRIKDAFDAYIFLSYRKKDRKYAQQLMQLIHANDFCRDVAIWYDEFLTPGDDFNEAILKALKKSQLFALVVTPNLLEEGNYVLTTEYPTAVHEKSNVLPVEMVQTSSEEFYRLYKGIRQCIQSDDDASMSALLKKMLAPVIRSEQNNSPQHLFFIGLAYFSGVELEVDRSKGMELIEKAAGQGLTVAAEKLADIYLSTEGRLSKNALKWLEKAVALCKEQNGFGLHYCDLMSRFIRMCVICGQTEKARMGITHLVEEADRFSTDDVQTFCEIKKICADLCIDFSAVHPECEDEYRPCAEKFLMDVCCIRKKTAHLNNEERCRFLAAKLDCLRLRLEPDDLLVLEDDKNINEWIGSEWMEINEKARLIEISSAEKILDACNSSVASECLLRMRTLCFLAERYSENTDDFDKAQSILNELLEWHRQFGEKNDYSFFEWSGKMAWICRRKGQYEQAVQILKNDLEKMSAVWGGNSPFVLRCQAELADLYRLQAYRNRKNPEAASLFREQEKKSQILITDVLEKAIAAMGEAHPDVLMIVKHARKFFAGSRFHQQKKFLDILKRKLMDKTQIFYLEEQIRNINDAAFAIKMSFFFCHGDKAEVLYQKYIKEAVSADQIIHANEKSSVSKISPESLMVIKKISDHYDRKGMVDEYVHSRLAFGLLLDNLLKNADDTVKQKIGPFSRKFLLREFRRMIRKLNSLKESDHARRVQECLQFLIGK